MALDFAPTDSSAVRAIALHAARGGELTTQALRIARAEGVPIRYDGIALLRVSDALPLARLVVAAMMPA